MGRSGLVATLSGVLVLAACGGAEPKPSALRSTASPVASTSTTSTAPATSVASTTTTSTPAAAPGPSPSTSASTTTPATTTTAPRSTGTWRTIPPAPGQAHEATVWTGAELIAWSGTGPDGLPVRGGVAYRPDGDRWRELPHGPLAPRTGHRSVWTGSEVLVWGGNTPGAEEPFADGAAYSPTSDTWRRLPAAPIPGRLYHHAVWTGAEMIVWGGSTQCCPIDSVIHDDAAAAYDPTTDRWTRLPDVPRPWSGDGGPSAVDRFGRDMVVWRAGHLARFDPAGGVWHDLGSPPERPSECRGWSTMSPYADGVVVGSRFFAWSGPCGLELGWTLDLVTNEWRDAPPPPPRLGAVHAGGDRIFGLVRSTAGGDDTSLVELDTRDLTWGPPSTAPVGASFPAATWSGTELLLWGRAGAGHRGGSAFSP